MSVNIWTQRVSVYQRIYQSTVGLREYYYISGYVSQQLDSGSISILEDMSVNSWTQGVSVY